MVRTQNPKLQRSGSKKTPSPDQTPLAKVAGPKSGGLLDRVLKRWDLVAETGLNLETLDVLHAAFLTNVPFENATKLVKATRSANPEAGIRGPVEFWEEHLRWGSGGTCFAATYAYRFLLRYLGFTCRFVFCHLPGHEDDAHSALLVTLEDTEVLVDVGYAIPSPLPLPSDGSLKRVTPYYDVEIRRGPQEEYLIFSEDDRGQRFRYRFTPAEITDLDYRRAWRKTFRPEAPYMKRLALGRFQAGTRFLYKDPTRVYEISRSGERAFPLEEPAVASLSRLFRLPQPLIAAALQSLKRLSE